MSAPIPPMNPSWAMGWERANGRPPSQRDWEAFINRQRNGGVEEPTTASQAAQFAGPVGTIAGMYAARKLPELFSSGAAKEGAKEGAKGIAEYFGLGGGSTAATEGVTGAGTFGAPMTMAPTAGTGTGIYGALGAAAPWAAGLGGAAGLYDVVSNFNDMSQTRGGLQGGLSGAALGFALGGPVGALIGAGGGGLLGSFAHKAQTQVEEGRWKELADQGFGVPDWVAQGVDINEKGAGARRDLASDFIGLAPTAGDAVGMGAVPKDTWVNNKFAESRDVGDLRAKDIWGYAALPELFGKDYMTTSEANREAIAAKALELGLVSEGKGTIDIKDDPALREYWTSLTAPKSANQQVADTVKDTVRRLYNK